jgi:hypothetical protein
MWPKKFNPIFCYLYTLWAPSLNSYTNKIRPNENIDRTTKPIIFKIIF